MRNGSQRAVVTGGAGFIGSHVCDRFLEQGYEVVAVDDLSTGNRENVPSGAHLEVLDIVDGEALAAACASSGRASSRTSPHRRA